MLAATYGLRRSECAGLLVCRDFGHEHDHQSYGGAVSGRVIYADSKGQIQLSDAAAVDSLRHYRRYSAPQNANRKSL